MLWENGHALPRGQLRPPATVMLLDIRACNALIVKQPGMVGIGRDPRLFHYRDLWIGEGMAWNNV